VATLSRSSQKGEFRIQLRQVEVSEFKDGQFNNLRDEIIKKSIEMTQHPIKIVRVSRNSKNIRD
jgi:hypothetical protein